jgi:hypothetical protein
LALAMLSPAALGQTSKKVNSLDQVKGAIANQAGQDKFREQISGIPMPDGFGTTLPEGVAPEKVVELLAPGADASLATLVGMKQWPYRPNTFVAIACLAADKAQHESTLEYSRGKPSCEASYGSGQCDYVPKEVYLALLEYRPDGGAPALVARSGKPEDIRIDWKDSKLAAPQCADEGPLRARDFSRFDLAPYKISATGTAFGLRVGWSEGYAGGGGEFEALMLFAQDGNRLINILSEPVYFMQNLAGSWHKDGTRDHSVGEGGNILSVLPRKTSDHYDLQLKTQGTKWKKVFVWDDKDKRYIVR